MIFTSPGKKTQIIFGPESEGKIDDELRRRQISFRVNLCIKLLFSLWGGGLKISCPVSSRPPSVLQRSTEYGEHTPEVMASMLSMSLARPVRAPTTRRAARPAHHTASRVSTRKAFAPARKQVRMDATQDKIQAIADDLMAKYEASDNKPAIWAGGTGALIALYTLSTVLNGLDRIPLVGFSLEVVGLGYSAWFTARYLLTEESRKELKTEADAFLAKVMG